MVNGPHLSPGLRVKVPFGKRKTYVGLIVKVHNQKPEGYEVKEILEVIDRKPIVLPSQLKLWHWISDYYMSPIGEVYKAALPSGLKAEDGYRPRTETFIRLTPKLQSEAALHVALNVLARAPRQLEAFITYLQLSGWDDPSSFPPPPSSLTSCISAAFSPQSPPSPLTPPAEISREELLNASGANLDTIKALQNRGFLETYEVPVSRISDAIGTTKSMVNGQWSMVNGQWSMVNGQWSMVNGQESSYDATLSRPQQQAYDSILDSMLSHQVTLLHGVTGSGKTEIYIHLIQRELQRRRQVLYLLPEIALTIQIMQRLRQVFGNRLGIWHSRYSDAERVEIWQKQLSEQPYDIILGARSAVFLPFQNLGLVIVDEEHDNSYKQQDPMPRYHARDTAIMLASMPKETPSPLTSNLSPLTPPRVLLGTATPSLETWHNTLTAKYGLVQLTQRYKGLQLPQVQVVDIKDLQHRKMMRGPFSPLLLLHVRQALENGQQAILFHNRRGFAPLLICPQCGWVPRCAHCDVSLTLHRTTNQLTCHYCGATYSLPAECPACGAKILQSRGYGTERIEDQIRDILPDARIARMDLDTTRTRNAYERIISDFAARRTNLLIGTQMITKGLDFDHVAVVGILDADALLNYPDFRAYEHAYNMITQVSGRAGRKHSQGLVILQTRQPDNYVIQSLLTPHPSPLTSHPSPLTSNIFNVLLQERQAFRYPPFTRLIYVYLRHRNDGLVDIAANEMASRLQQTFGTRVLGPDKPPVARVKSLSIRKLVIKLEKTLDLSQVRASLRLIQQQMMQDKRYASLQIYYDVDPV